MPTLNWRQPAHATRLRSGDFFKQSTKYWPEGNAWLFDYKERSGGEKEILVYVTRRGIEVNTWQLAP